jgi:hypothetical protein
MYSCEIGFNLAKMKVDIWNIYKWQRPSADNR